MTIYTQISKTPDGKSSSVTLGQKLRLWRFRRHLSRQALGHLASVGEEWIGALELGHTDKADSWRLELLADALGVHLEELLTPVAVTPEERVLLALFEQLKSEQD